MNQGAKIAQASPGASLLPGDGGYSYYSKTVEDVKAGTPVDLAFTYTLPSVGQTGTAAAGAGSSDVVPLLFLSVLFGGGLIAMVFGVRRKLAAKAAVREAAEAKTQPKAKSGRATKTVATDAEAHDSAERAAGSDPARVARTRKVVTGVIVVALVVAIVAIGRQATSSDFIDGKLTRSFGGVSPCTSVSIPLTPNAGVDLEASAGKLMDSLNGLESIGEVTIWLNPAKIDVAYCESTLTEQVVRDALATAGVASLGASSTAQ